VALALSAHGCYSTPKLFPATSNLIRLQRPCKMLPTKESGELSSPLEP